MKKFTLVLFVALLSTGFTSAQDKPTKGSIGTEIQFNPFDQDGKTFQLDGLKLRYFLTDKDALRLKFGFGISSGKYQEDATEDDYVKFKTGDFSLDLGYERHFNLAKRLSWYIGGQVGAFKHFASAKQELTDDRTDRVYTVLWFNTTGEGDDADRAYTGFKASAFTGLDFYIYKGLYIGTELGFSGKIIKTCETKRTYRGETEKSKDSYRETSAGFYLEPVIRLGWSF